MIVLASTSTTRQTMLRNAGIPFAIESPSIDEAALIRNNPGWSSEYTASQLAQAKALSVSKQIPDKIVIGSDQVLAVGKKLYGKPRDHAAARQQLRELRGNRHMLISAVACVKDDKVIWTETRSALLKMRNFSDTFLDDYLQANGERTYQSVGGYQVEGAGIQLFESIEGDHFTILGLPLLNLLEFLRSTGEIPS